MLRRWGDGLSRDDREEVRAAGRAILMLSDEIERLHVELWHARDHSEAAAEASEPQWPRTSADENVSSALRERLSAFRLLGRNE
jgi:hypothetical protein